MAGEENLNNTEVGQNPSGLPSDAPEVSALDEFIKNNPDYEFLKEHGNVEDLKAKLSGNANKETPAVEENNNPEPQVTVNMDIINDMIPKFIENGMQLTDEMVAQLKEAGVDERDIKLGAYEVAQATQAAYNVVGGEAEYRAMIEWANAGNLTQEEAAQFNSELQKDNRKFAILGLHSMFKQSQGSGQTNPRINGDKSTHTTTSKGYQSKREMQDDMAYLRSHPRDFDAQRRYDLKMKYTNPAILG